MSRPDLIKLYEDPTELAKRRKLLGLTQAKLALAARVERTWLVMVEQGKINIAAEKIKPSTEAKLSRVWTILDAVQKERRTELKVLHNSVYQAWRKRHSKKPLEGATVVLPSQKRMANLADLVQVGSLSAAAPQEMQLLKARLQTSDALIAIQDELITCLQEFVALHEGESQQKDMRIADLKTKVHELRGLYELETEVAVKSAQAEELREKLSAIPIKEGKV